MKTTRLVIFAIVVLSIITAVSTSHAKETNAPLACGEHGILDDDTCVCDDGYITTNELAPCSYHQASQTVAFGLSAIAGKLGLGNLYVGNYIQGLTKLASGAMLYMYSRLKPIEKIGVLRKTGVYEAVQDRFGYGRIMSVIALIDLWWPIVDNAWWALDAAGFLLGVKNDANNKPLRPFALSPRSIESQDKIIARELAIQAKRVKENETVGAKIEVPIVQTECPRHSYRVETGACACEKGYTTTDARFPCSYEQFSRAITVLLGAVLGKFGIEHFYVGNYIQGTLKFASGVLSSFYTTIATAMPAGALLGPIYVLNFIQQKTGIPISDRLVGPVMLISPFIPLVDYVWWGIDILGYLVGIKSDGQGQPLKAIFG